MAEREGAEHAGYVDLDELRVAIDSKRELSGIAPYEHFGIPAEWTRTYPATAKGVPAAESLSAQAAAELVASFVNPALAMSSNPAAWDPHAMAWIQDTTGSAEAPADA
jgi:hypothetical protein